MAVSGFTPITVALVRERDTSVIIKLETKVTRDTYMVRAAVVTITGDPVTVVGGFTIVAVAHFWQALVHDEVFSVGAVEGNTSFGPEDLGFIYVRVIKHGIKLTFDFLNIFKLVELSSDHFKFVSSVARQTPVHNLVNTGTIVDT
jgi:hypothetical protein